MTFIYASANVFVFGTDAEPDFESEIAPLLIKRCVECHQGDDPSGGFLLTSAAGLQEGGDSGAAIEPESLNESYLLERIVSGEMPPVKQGQSQKLPDDEIDLIRRWVTNGANWPKNRELDFFERTNEMRAGRDWWSLQPISKPHIPRLSGNHQPSNPIDAFIQKKLEYESISPAPRADRRTLIRRLYYDLIGLPPSESDMSSLTRDDDPLWWQKLIDRLLETPQYGERWARFWLDLARYADTSGYERDQEKPYAWKYRDWVIDAFNDDLPYGDFITQQLAGDEIPGADERSVIATGFLRLGTWNDEPNDPADYVYDRLEDLVHTTSSTFLALTVKCARCHAHKFDAIKQEDYYRMASAFWVGPIETGRPRDQLGGPSSKELGFENVLAWTDSGKQPKPLHLLKNGDRLHPLGKVEPASLSTIPLLEREFDSPTDDAKTTHRRLQLARWIADAKNPLTARVIVNRIWQHHFGQAIVRTPNNFGFLAAPPTHPELLDWLASEFLKGGGRIKSLHRMILTSETWMQSSLHPNANELENRDAANQLWWRFNRERLDAESLRDSLLAASGELDLTMGGPGFKPTISPEVLEGLSRKSSAWTASKLELQHRRSIYMYLKRGLLPPMMTTFDLCDPTLSCGQRDVTIVPTQALAMMNNQFVHERSEHLARSITTKHSKIHARIRAAWSSILGRQPTQLELEQSSRHLDIQKASFRSSSQGESKTNDCAKSLVLHIRADQAQTDGGSSEHGDPIDLIPDLSGQNHQARQTNPDARPILIEKGIGGQQTIRFDGKGQFLSLAGQILDQSVCTVVCVVNDSGNPGHREIISNWNRSAGNIGTSIFLGLTSDNTIRFSDAIPNGGEISNRGTPFILTATNGSGAAKIFQNSRHLKSSRPLPNRRLDTPWVIGAQGDINGEYWKGDMAEIRVYNRELNDAERLAVETQLSKRYGIRLNPSNLNQPRSPETLAIASLCHVLMNSNEFLYVD